MLHIGLFNLDIASRHASDSTLLEDRSGDGPARIVEVTL